MHRFLCWLLSHRWEEVSRRNTMDLDHTEYRCTRCGEEAGGAAGLFIPPKRPPPF